MRKAKIVIKEKGFDEEGLCYTTKDKGDEGVCFTMAIGYVVNLAKTNEVPLKSLNNIIKDAYKETEEVEDGKN